MKKLVLSIITLLTFNVLIAQNKTVNINTEKSNIHWLGKKMTGQHDGDIKLKSGALVLKGTTLVGGEFVVDMNSITCTDLKDEEYNGKLVGHLKADDFFGTEKFPTAALKITKIAKVKNKTSTYSVTADLTIKDITKPVVFTAVVTTKAGKTTAKAKIKVNRTKYDIKYGSASFFDSLGDKAIKDIFDLDVVLETL